MCCICEKVVPCKLVSIVQLTVCQDTRVLVRLTGKTAPLVPLKKDISTNIGHGTTSCVS